MASVVILWARLPFYSFKFLIPSASKFNFSITKLIASTPISDCKSLTFVIVVVVWLFSIGFEGKFFIKYKKCSLEIDTDTTMSIKE